MYIDIKVLQAQCPFHTTDSLSITQIYLQILSCISSKPDSVADNNVMNYIKLPLEKCKAIQFYKTANASLFNDSNIMRLIWQRDISVEIKCDNWAKMFADCGKYVREARGKLTQYKILHRYFYTPSKVHRMKKGPLEKGLGTT